MYFFLSRVPSAGLLDAPGCSVRNRTDTVGRLCRITAACGGMLCRLARARMFVSVGETGEKWAIIRKSTLKNREK